MNWSDPAFLRSVSAIIQWMVISFALLAVGLQTAKHFIDLREKRISSELTAKKDKANDDEKRDLREKLVQSEQRVRTLSVEVTLDVAAKWKDDKPPDPRKWTRVGGDASDATTHLVLADGTVVPVEFAAADGIRFTQLDNGETRMRFIADAKPDSAVFSMLPSQIIAIERSECACFGVDGTALADRHTVIRRARWNFYVNGRASFFVEVVGDIVTGEVDAYQNQTRILLGFRVPVVHTTP